MRQVRNRTLLLNIDLLILACLVLFCSILGRSILGLFVSKVAPPEGFEPPTKSLEGSCSVH